MATYEAGANGKGKVIIQEYTQKNPITMIGYEAGVCWGANTSDSALNFKRGMDCLENEHGRTWEFPDVFTIIDGYSARVIREWYTHIGCLPTRLQASTRYIDYESGFDYIIPNSIARNEEALEVYESLMDCIQSSLSELDELGIPREDSAMGLPLGMATKIVDKRNFRNIVDMCKQRLCNRAYWEYRKLVSDYLKALSEYSDEWKILVDNYCKAKCDIFGYCKEKFTCGKKPRKED